MKEKWMEFYEIALELGYSEEQAGLMADKQLTDLLADNIDDYRLQQKEFQNG